MTHKIFRSFFVLILVIVSVVVPAPQSARAAGPWYVTSTGDDNNDCLSPGTACATVNEAIGKASPGDVINVAIGTYADGALLDKSVTLLGGWDSTFTTQNGSSILDGTSVTINTGVTALIDRFTVQNGVPIYNGGGDVTLNNSLIQGNTGVGGSGGGIFNGGDLTINNSVIRGNTTFGIGGGIYNPSENTTVILNNSAVISNTGIYGGGISASAGTVILNNSTVSGNTASADGGGIGTLCGGVCGIVILNNSTVSGNTASGTGGGVTNGGDPGTITLSNTIVANNSATSGGADCSGPIVSAGYNLIGDTSNCNFTSGNGDLTNVDPKIGLLIGPSGVPQYHPLLSGSPAIDAGNPTGCTDQNANLLTTDQRGVSRPQGSACDIGAYEYATPGLTTSILVFNGNGQRAGPNLDFPKPFEVLALDGQGSPVIGETVTFTAPTSGPSGNFKNSGTNVTTADTNNSGVAIAPTFTANNQIGSYSVVATISGSSSTANFALANFAWYVTTTGNDGNDCQTPLTPCATINNVLGMADFISGDTILVGAGIYSTADTGGWGVLLDKSARLLGGWDADFTTQNSSSTLDGQGVSRGITVFNVTAHIERFVIKNGVGSGIVTSGILTVINSSISNSSGGDGGGINNHGTLTVSNSTLSNNHADFDGGGIYNSGGTLTLHNVTLADNSSANRGGGLYVQSGNVTAHNGILARNTAANFGPDCVGTITVSHHNIIGNTSSCAVTAGTGDQFNVDPQLGTFLPTQGYYPLLPSSPAIDAGDNATCLNVDQRGVARPQGTGCDIGAYEYTTPGPAASLSVISGNGQLTGTTSTFSKPLQAAALDSQGSPVSGVTIDFTAPASGPSGTFADTGTNTTSVDTDAGGVATTSIFTANDQAGAYTVSASAPGLGFVDFSLEQVSRPANDNFTNAAAIPSIPFSAATDITHAGSEPSEPQFCNSMEHTVWYIFTPSSTMRIRADTQGGISATVSIFRATGPGITDLQFLGCASPNSPTNFLAEAGETYYLQAGPAFGEIGTMQFSLTELSTIAGRVTDALTGAPLSGDALIFATVTLQRVCGADCLEPITSQGLDSDSRFLFDSYFGGPLPTGTYKIEVSTRLYQTEQFGPFEFSGVNLDVGDLPIDALPLIGSISGRVIDAVTGKPISAAFAPFVTLNRCDQHGCVTVNSQASDSSGRFQFETDNSGNHLTVGTYQVVAFADQYEQGQTDLFDVGEGEHRVIDVRLNSLLPVRFSEVQPCADLPATGGDCVYSVKITNGLATRLQGAAWSMVYNSLPGSFSGFTNFQTRQPQGISLAPGKSKVIQFKFRVPANNSPDESFVCTQVYVGQGTRPLFDTVGQRDLFCVFRGATGFRIMTPEELQASFQQSQANEPAGPLSETLNEQAVTAANGTDIEPNDTCSTAQDAGAVTLPFTLDGNLDSTQTSDVDFFRFSSTAGALVIVGLEGQGSGKGTLGDPLLGAFDSACNLIGIDDGSGGNLNSRLELTIPPDGIYVLAATICCDFGFNGGGNGTYQLTIAPWQVIGSISGRVTDAVTGKFLRGDIAPFAYVRLQRCGAFGCNDVNAQAAGSDGRFHFTSDQNGGPLRTGTYKVIVEADQYQPGQPDPFEVGEEENRDIGDVPLQSNPVRFSNIQSCAVPSGGGNCDFSVTVTNGLSTLLKGKAWSIVDGSGLGSFIGFTRFQTSDPQAVSLTMAKSKVLRFRFRVPGTVADGATICTQVFVGQGKDAFFNTVGAGQLFCLTKGTGGFTLLSEKEAQAAFRELQNSDSILPNSKGDKKK